VKTSSDKDPNCFISFNEVISGPRALILQSSGDPNVAGINFHDVHFGILQINNANTYSGGTFINGGKINVRKTGGLGTGTVTLDKFGTLSTDANLANPVVINQGTLFHCTLSGPITLNGIAGFISHCSISGGMSGAGGFTMYGANGSHRSKLNLSLARCQQAAMTSKEAILVASSSRTPAQMRSFSMQESAAEALPGGLARSA
jgi:autotransporter-associated beta strand protein